SRREAGPKRLDPRRGRKRVVNLDGGPGEIDLTLIIRASEGGEHQSRGPIDRLGSVQSDRRCSVHSTAGRVELEAHEWPGGSARDPPGYRQRRQSTARLVPQGEGWLRGRGVD